MSEAERTCRVVQVNRWGDCCVMWWEPSGLCGQSDLMPRRDAVALLESGRLETPASVKYGKPRDAA
jgi:hypothetical protein